METMPSESLNEMLIQHLSRLPLPFSYHELAKIISDLLLEEEEREFDTTNLPPRGIVGLKILLEDGTYARVLSVYQDILEVVTNWGGKKLVRWQKSRITNLTTYRQNRDQNASEREKKAREIADGLINTQNCLVRIGKMFMLESVHQRFPLSHVSNIEGLECYIELVKQCPPRSEISALREICDRYGIKSLYYITHVNNLTSILDVGILCHNLAPDGHYSFANPKIQDNRHNKIPNLKLPFTLHDYVPLFFTPKPPLLYLLKEMQDQLIHIHISPRVLLEPGTTFSSMNARSPRAQFYFDYRQLDQLRWDIIFGDSWESPDEEEKRQLKLIRQAEVNVPLRIVPDKFRMVTINSPKFKMHLDKIIAHSGYPIPISVRPDLYF